VNARPENDMLYNKKKKIKKKKNKIKKKVKTNIKNKKKKRKKIKIKKKKRDSGGVRISFPLSVKCSTYKRSSTQEWR